MRKSKKRSVQLQLGKLRAQSPTRNQALQKQMSKYQNNSARNKSSEYLASSSDLNLGSNLPPPSSGELIKGKAFDEIPATNFEVDFPYAIVDDDSEEPDASAGPKLLRESASRTSKNKSASSMFQTFRGRFRSRRFQRSQTMEVTKPVSPRKIPIIIVTDIGADIDDTLALFVMFGATDIFDIVAIVTSVNNGLHRGAVTRGFLRILGVHDDDVEILPSVDGCIAGCYIPESFPNSKAAKMGSLENTPQRILEICTKYQDTGIYIMGIASLTPIAQAIELDKQAGGNVMEKAIRKVYLQGNVDIVVDPSEPGEEVIRTADPVEVSEKNVRLEPNPDAYNFKNDMEAAKLVFDHLQDHAQFTILGKHAAYSVPIRKGDFAGWSEQIRCAWKDTTTADYPHDIPTPPDLLLTAKRQMKTFRAKNPSKFDQIYFIPEGLTDLEIEKFNWFDDMPGSYVCSHPYDPLLGLCIVEDVRTMNRQKTKSFLSDPIFPKVLKAKSNKKSMLPAASLFKRYYCNNVNGQRHVLLGNIPTRTSIENSDLVHDTLVAHIMSGLCFHGPKDLDA